jgi:hypothetical protein
MHFTHYMAKAKTWMAGTSPAMTMRMDARIKSAH